MGGLDVAIVTCGDDGRGGTRGSRGDGRVT